ncbi:MAG TPA: hypothetical protein VIM11_07075 [Tepidisphaeraceae bacterium]|jgi:hypothetical protein
MMTPDIATRLPITQPGTSGQENNAVKSPAEQGNDLKAEFRDRMDNSVNGVQPTEAVTATNPTNTIESTQRVNRGNVPDKQDMFGQFDKIRGEFDAFLKRSGELDKAVADGKLKINDPKVAQQRREEMRMLLHFQSEMQGTAMKVEIASKVVEHGTSGVKTVLSTQA